MDDMEILGSILFCLVILAFLLVGVLYLEKLMLGTTKKRRASFQPRPLPRAARSNPVVRRANR
jgi:uncharacterized membrane protein